MLSRKYTVFSLFLPFYANLVYIPQDGSCCRSASIFHLLIDIPGICCELRIGMALERETAEDRTMIQWGRRINSMAYSILSSIVVIIGAILLIGGLCILMFGLLR